MTLAEMCREHCRQYEVRTWCMRLDEDDHLRLTAWDPESDEMVTFELRANELVEVGRRKAS